MQIILGIDPGSRTTGFGIIEVTRKKPIYLHHGQINTRNENLSERLYEIYYGLSQIIQQYRPNCVAIEQVFMHRNANSALKLGHARGAALVAAGIASLSISEYSPREIKQAVVGYGNASKDQVQHMIKLLLGLKNQPQSDAADALAVAICHCHSQTMLHKIKASEKA